MNDNLIALLGNFRPLRILIVLSFFRNGLHVRELASFANLSPSSVSDTLKLLEEHRLITKTKHGNKIFVTCNLNDEERKLIKLLEEQKRKKIYLASSLALTNKAIDCLRWNTEMLKVIRKAKNNATT